MEENTIDMSQLERIMSVVKLMQSINGGDASAQVQETAGYDNVTALQKIKEALPHLDTPYQRNLGIMIKLMEIDKLIHTFQAMSFDSGNSSRGVKKKMLMAIKPELDYKKQQVLDVCVKAMEISDIVEDLRFGEQDS